ncbi:hypothetical protein [Geodermatophilus pulveris]|uniref:hypothetical protein n=1 Tax=Geodermatophilus pulveris TaxID=1564159 RepID=UPI000B77E68D|nr:hypothetical protein [Geodermatophilus pulveris]
MPDEDLQIIELVHNLATFRQDTELAGRLSDIEADLNAWSAGSDLRGQMASDALDQLSGLLPDIASIAQQLVPEIEAMMKRLPRMPD